MEKVAAVVAIKRFFEVNGGRAVSIPEIKQLSKGDREELGKLAAVELGVEIKEA